MEITLEKIELVKDRTGASYREAKEALEQTEGNVVDAIILIEDTIDQSIKPSDSKIEAIVNVIKDAIKKGNVSKIVVKKGGEIILNLPVNIGVVGTVLFPWATVIGSIAALGTKCSVEIVKDNGEIVDVSSKAAGVVEVAKSKGGVVLDEVKDKGSDVLDLAKDKGKDAFEFAKDKGKDAWDFAKEKGLDAFDFAKDKGKDAFEAAKDLGKDAFEVAKEKATDAFKKDENKDSIDETVFGDLDITEIDFSELEEDDE